MPKPRTPSLCLARLALAASLALLAGCGNQPEIHDTAETIRPEPTKPTPAPEATSVPEATPAKEAPKG